MHPPQRALSTNVWDRLKANSFKSNKSALEENKYERDIANQQKINSSMYLMTAAEAAE